MRKYSPPMSSNGSRNVMELPELDDDEAASKPVSASTIASLGGLRPAPEARKKRRPAAAGTRPTILGAWRRRAQGVGHFPKHDKRQKSAGASPGACPICWYPSGVATRPRGVRFRKP